ncbi:MAG: electron transport complex subunit RsxG [Gammaproteobacteria bacterium]|nr:electron transport complex subunit RsxG [Gammaproteobacteria bacterium]MDH5514435.1 electron transport complex subunit RsxG [Gammaproteobacteria bacterium]
MNYRQIIITAVILLLFTVLGTSMVAFTYDGTREKIAANERATLQRKLNQLLPAGSYDNDLLEDRITVTLPEANERDKVITVYRARNNSADAGLVMTAVAPDGYSGRIKMLIGIRADDTLSGVRIITHRETPGLGDAIDEQRSDWVLGFDGKSLGNPPIKQWRVKKDGGVFDQLTGATITPRAIVKAVRRTLLYYQANREMLYSTAPITE